MKVLTKKEVEESFGKYGFFEGAGKSLVNTTHYLSGLAPFDELITSKKLDPKIYATNIEHRPKGLVVSLLSGFTFYNIGLTHNQIKAVSIEAQEQIFKDKEKSVVGRALVGGLLLGPVGALVGGMTAFTPGKEKVGNLPENILSIVYSTEDNEGIILFSFKNKGLKEVDQFLNTFLKDKRKAPAEIELPKDTTPQPQASIADEIVKLKGLLESGILTQEEYDTSKKKLLEKY